MSQLTRDLRLKLIYQILQCLSLSCKQLILIDTAEAKTGQEASFDPRLTQMGCTLVKPVCKEGASETEPVVQ